MPISDTDPYQPGHFKRVYEHIIKPAVLKAGFNPVRADDILHTNFIAIDILKRIISSEMAICDLSSKNPNVLYELGIRQAFDLPVTFIKDTITERVFDIQGFRDIEYDENLRIDNVEQTIDIISETIKNTFSSKGSAEINSLVSLLGIQSAKVSKQYEITADTQLMLNTLDTLSSRMIEIEKSISAIRVSQNSPNTNDEVPNLPILSQSEIKALQVGDIVYHRKFGVGTITKIEGTKQNPVATIPFSSGEKKIMLNFANLIKHTPTK
jgi:hypothetical protein